MSAETTPSIERAAREWAPGLFGEENEAGIIRTTGRPHLEWKQEHVRGLARRILTSAVDVEEMARAIHASDQGPDVWDIEGEKFKDVYRANARAAIAAILGTTP